MHPLAKLFSPKSVALIGASPDTNSFRGRLSSVLLKHQGNTSISFVSHSHDQIEGLPCHKSIIDLPECVDLAILAIPARFVPDALEECGQAGVKAALVVSSGFADEQSAPGDARQSAVAAICLKYGIALLGPNSQGFLNTQLPFAATFSAGVCDGEHHGQNFSNGRKGVALISQSGGLGFGIYSKARRQGITFTHVIATGNQATVGVLDVVDFAIDDESTKAIVVIIESLRDAERLSAIMQKAARKKKPVIVTKIGRSEAGAKAAESHTGALSGSYKVYQSVFRRYGLQEAGNTDELVALAACYFHFADVLPGGNRVAILTPSGGAGIMMADMCEDFGLEIGPLDDATRKRLDSILPDYASHSNPVDISAQGVIETGYAKPLAILSKSPSVDAVIVITATYTSEYIEADFDILREVRRVTKKPIVFCSYTRPSPAVLAKLTELRFPCLSDLHHCASALASMNAYRKFGERVLLDDNANREPHLGGQRQFDIALPHDDTRMCEYEIKDIFRSLGLSSSPGQLVQTADDAVAFFKTCGKAIAMKIQSPSIPHKTEVSGVKLGLDSARSVCDAFDSLMEDAESKYGDARIHGVLVEPMAAPGVELIVGISKDPNFGQVLTVGMGGVLVELIDDFQIEPLPVSKVRALNMLMRLKAWPILDGFRGKEAADVQSLSRLITTMSDFVESNGDRIQELDLNPVIVHSRGNGLTIADALIVLDPQERSSQYACSG